MAVRKNAPKEAEAKVAAAEGMEAALKKAPGRKAAAPKKTVARKAAVPESNVYVEYADKKIVAKEVLATAMESYKAAHADTEIQTIEVYMKPEENVAYYVVNGEGSSEFKVEL